MDDILTSNNISTAYNNSNTNNNTAAAGCSSSPPGTTCFPNHPNLSITTTPTTAKAAAAAASSQPSTPSERKIRPQKDQAINCPRCNSTNTKFCYYNNYSLAQPRYFCKTCRRYWTEGGSLRNIPVGGGSRKNKRSSPSSSSLLTSPVSKIKLPDLVAAPPICSTSNSNPNNSTTTTTTAPPGHGINVLLHHQHHEGQGQGQGQHRPHHDLNLGFPTSLSDFMTLPNIETTDKQNNNAVLVQMTNQNSSHMSALELLTGLTSSTRGSFNSFMPIHMSSSPYQTGGFSLQGDDHHFKPTLGFSLGYENGEQQHHMQDGNGMGGRMLFPFQDLSNNNNNNSSTTEAEAAARISSSTVGAAVGHHQNYSHEEENDDDGQQIGKVHNNHHHQGSSPGYWSGMLGGAGSW